ncbi:MAG: DUF2851 family protein [Cyclobacteriaceae bacterium]
MQEAFLHYIWQLQYLNKNDLKTEDGEDVEVFDPGTLNGDAGPDFSSARIRIAEMEWVGNVEIHTNSSNWYDHGHEEDAAYENVVLHVVWRDDKPVLRGDKTKIPTIALQNRVDKSLIEKYKKLVESPTSIPCERVFPKVMDIVKFSMLDKAAMLRLERKSETATQLAKASDSDWEGVTYHLMGRNFGFKLNFEPFQQLTNSVRRKILLKHADNLTQIEALLFGQAGFLDHGIKDDYFKLLTREYKVLSSKYALENQKISKSLWKFLRLRPANFPTIRIAQFSALMYENQNLFSRIVEASSYDEMVKLFEVKTSDYWHNHYRFGRKTARSLSGMGKDSINNIIINTVVPLLVAYGKFKDEQALVDRALTLLQQIPSEKNRIVKAWEEIGYKSRSALDSQALIELNNNFCLKRKCLSCSVGIEILKPN